ncbi:hypothetical protein SSBG_06086 [Streptomyces sp. SPB074]|nr:hypothetical protein SSBG_06086 [Streptomyces sp. SPB074]
MKPPQVTSRAARPTGRAPAGHGAARFRRRARVPHQRPHLPLSRQHHTH